MSAEHLTLDQRRRNPQKDGAMFGELQRVQSTLQDMMDRCALPYGNDAWMRLSKAWQAVDLAMESLNICDPFDALAAEFGDTAVVDLGAERVRVAE